MGKHGVALQLTEIRQGQQSAQFEQLHLVKRQENLGFKRPKVSQKVKDQIMYLYEFNKQSPREIAQECQLSLGTVCYYLHQD